MYWDKPKNSVPYENAFSGGFFAYYAEVESGIKKRFTLPVSNICADQGGNVPSLGRKYINEWTNSRGLLNGKVKMSCNQNGNAGFKDKKVSTLIVCNDNSAKIIDTNTLPSDCKYALSGVPVIREKNDVNWKSYVIPMGWSS